MMSFGKALRHFFETRHTRILMGAGVLLASALVLTPARAARDEISFIRDAEIEHYLHDLATPIYRAAGIDPAMVHIYLIRSGEVNAFVADGMNEFFYTGLLQMTETPEQLAGVIAHETGHIAGGHLIRGREAMANASAQALIGALLGIAAGIATGNGQATIATMGGAENVAERSLLSFSRAQEASADSAGLSFLDRANISSDGMQQFMEKLSGQEALPTDRQSEYVRTHPLTQDRIGAIASHIQATPHHAALDPKFKEMHARMKAKLQGFLQPESVLLRTTDKDPKRDTRYARAIALYLTNAMPRALALADALLQEEPSNPYFYELKAQMLFEHGRIDEATPLYEKAVTLAPDSSLLHVAFAHSLLETKAQNRPDLAIQHLLTANKIEPHDSETWHLLALAWGHKAEANGDPQLQGMATYALAEEALSRGADREARQLTDRALKILTRGSPYWVKAQDIKLSTEGVAEH